MPLGEMKIGDVVAMTSVQVLYGDPKGEYMRMTFNAKPKRRMCFLFLGDESRDGTTEPLDPIKRLYQLGWSHPELKPES